MKCPIVLKQEVQEVVDKLGLRKLVTDNNVHQLAQYYGIIPRDDNKKKGARTLRER